MRFDRRWYGPYDPNAYRYQWWQQRADRNAWMGFAFGLAAVGALWSIAASLFRRQPQPRRAEPPRDLFKNW